MINLGQISGDLSNTINQLPVSSDPDLTKLKDLLTQLQQLIEAEPNLNHEDKAEALEQVKVLAAAGQKPNDGPLKKAAKTAMKILKGTVAGVPATTQFLSNFSGLLTAISKLLCLV